MPADGVDLTPANELLTPTELHRLAKIFVSQGVQKVRLTGGEPLVRKDMVEVVSGLGSLGLSRLGLTTNGLLLRRKLPDLVAAGLTHLNVSLDTLQPDKFELIARRPGFDRVIEGIDQATSLLSGVKLNCVVMRNMNDAEIPDFVELTRHKPLEVRFIEYMPFDGNQWKDGKLVTYKEMKALAESRHGPLEPVGEEVNGIAKIWRVPGHVGTVGFITSMTDHFCATCSRMRLTADGHLKVCLFGGSEVDLRPALRGGATDSDIAAQIDAAVARKKAHHAGMYDMYEIADTKNRPMIKIGG